MSDRTETTTGLFKRLLGMDNALQLYLLHYKNPVPLLHTACGSGLGSLIAMTKYLRSSFYGGGLIGAHSLRVHSPSWKAWWLGQEAAGHMAITIRKQREMDAGALLFIQCV